MIPVPAKPEITPLSSIRVMTVCDLHQAKKLYHELADAVRSHQPDVVVFGGDVLHALHFQPELQFPITECARLLAALPTEHLLFVRGNHEHTNWTDFVLAWPHAKRPLIGLHGDSFQIGSLVIIGFPCLMGDDATWCSHLPANSNAMEQSPTKQREQLRGYESWLPALMRKLGPTGRALWIMHEPPVAQPLSSANLCNLKWGDAVERFKPLVVVAGHDHNPRAWNVPLGTTSCINVGQSEAVLHYCVLDFEFVSDSPLLPLKINMEAFPLARRPAK